MWKILKLFSLKNLLFTTIAAGVIAGGLWVRSAINTALDHAEERGRQEILAVYREEVDRQIERRTRENREEIRDLQQKLQDERIATAELERKLLIEHDLHRLLQARPQMILDRVNRGTAEVFQELEEITR